MNAPRVRLIGRDDLLRQLQQVLETTKRAAVSPPEQALTPAGWGLSRLANAVCFQWSGKVVRLCGKSDMAWYHSLLLAAQELDLRAKYLRKPQDAFLGVRRWLRGNPQALLLIDDAEDAERIAEFLAPLQENPVLLTIHDPRQLPPRWPGAYRLPRFSQEVAEVFLKEYCGEGSHPDKSVSTVAELLHGHPDTLVQVGLLIQQGLSWNVLESALSEHVCSSKDFAVQVGQVLVPLLKSVPELVEQIDVWAWNGKLSDAVRRELRREQLSPIGQQRLHKVIQTIDRPDSVSADPLPQLLIREQCASSLLDQGHMEPDGLRLIQHAAQEALRIGAWQRGAELGQRLVQRLLAATPRQTDFIAETYLLMGKCYFQGERFGLARRQYRAALEFLSTRLELAADTLMNIVEIDLNENRIDTAAERLEHVGTLHAAANIDGMHLGRARRLFLRGATLVARKKFDDAVRVLQRSLALRMELLPGDHPDILQHLSLLTRAAFAKSDVELSEQAVRMDLQIRRDSPQVTEAELTVPMLSLADLLFSQGRYGEAEPLYEEALQLREQLYLADDRRIAETLGRLAILKSARGAYRESDPLFRRCLQLAEELFGEDHPQVAKVLNDLAESLFAQGKYDQTKRILDRALRIQQAALRTNDPALGRTRNNLAALHVSVGRFEVAEQLYQTDLDFKRKSFPAGHPWLATSLNNLGEVLRSQGKLTAAEAAFQEALDIRQAVFGPHHPQVAQSLSNLGYVLLLQHRLDAARNMFEQALEMRESALGIVHPHRASSLALLGQTLAFQRQFDAARERLTQAVEVAEQVYGVQHSQPAHLTCRLARVELQLGRKARAELLLLKAKSILEKEVGPNHRFFAEALIGLGDLYQRERKWEQAFPLLERALAILRQTMQGPRFEIGETLLMLGENLHARGVSQEAHARLLECYRIWSSLLDEQDPHFLACATLLGELAVQHGDPQQAEMLLDQALTHAEKEAATAQIDKLVPLVADAKAKLGKYDAAEEMLQRQLTRLLQSPGNSDRLQLNVLSHLAGVNVLRQDFTAAIPVIQQCIQLAERLNGLHHVETAKHLDNLAGVYFLQEKFADAEPLIGRAVQIFQDRLGVQHPATLAAMKNFSRLLKKLNRESQAQAVEDTVHEAQELQSHVLDDLF